MIIFSHPTGNANVRAIVNKFASQKMLYRFYTSIASYPGNFWFYLGGYSPFTELRRRTFDKGLEKYTNTFPWMDLGRSLVHKMGLKQLYEFEKGFFSVDNIYKVIDKRVAADLLAAKKNGVKAVYAYEDGALETFIRAKELGLICIYDLPIAYWEIGRKLMKEEALRLPQWALTLGGGILDSEAKLERKTRELELADVIVGPGSFVINSLPEWSKYKIKIVSPFGSPENNYEKKTSNSNLDIPLRVLFVGSMGQRKGLGDLFEAINLLNGTAIELVVLGSLLAPMDFYRSQLLNFTYEPGRSHKEVLKLMRSCDVFCLPSIVEGRALVVQEAMSQGLPIIITSNTGGEDLVIEGETGFLIPIRSPNMIAEKIKWFVENREQVIIMGEKAVKHSQKYTWDNYSDTIVEQLKLINVI